MTASSRGVVSMLLGAFALAGTAACSRDDSEVTPPETAAAEFSRVREQLGPQNPLVEIKDDGSTVVHRSDASRATDIQSFHALVYEMPSRKLLRVNVPFWAMRHLRSSGFTYLGQFYFLEDTEFDPVRVGLTLSDVERHGRGLLVDHRRASGAQFLAWLE
jgi:hypothetical protein